MSFYLSKLILFSLVSCCQAFLVVSFMWFFCSPPGSILNICFILFIQAIAGTVLGLAISVYSNTESTAVNLIPLALIPQIILSGLIAAPLKGIALTISKLFVTCYWGYQAMISVIPDKIASDAGISQENTIEILFILLFHIIGYTIIALTGMYIQERRDIVFIRALVLLAEKTKAIGGIK
jgi:ABC-2 type transport system permease protein